MAIKSSFLSVRTVAVTKAATALEAKDAGMSLSDYVLAAILKENAARATKRAVLPSHNQVAAEDAARRQWFCGSQYSPDVWPALDNVLEAMGLEFGNRDFRTSLFAEMAVRRPEIPVAAYTASQLEIDAAPLIQAAFEDFFSSEPEAKFDAFSISDTARLLLAEILGWENGRAANAHRTDQMVEYTYAEADRAGVAGRRGHTRRVLRQMRERVQPWPAIEILPGGTPRIADGVRLKFETKEGRRQPYFSNEPDAPPPQPVMSLAEAAASGITSRGSIGGVAERPRIRRGRIGGDK